MVDFLTSSRGKYAVFDAPGAHVKVLAATPRPMELIAAPPPADTGPDAKDLTFRRTFGLDENIDTIRELKAAGSSSATPMPYGVVLTPAEQAEVTFRAQVLEPAERTPQVNDYISAHADTFGGLYLDQAGGGVVTFLFTSDIAARTAELRSIFARPDRLVVRQVDYTDAELSSVKEISADYPFLVSLGLQQVGVDTIDNAVKIAGPGANVDSLVALQNHFGQLPVRVLLQPTGPIQQNGATGKFPLPFKGGESITRWNKNMATPCTLGFIVVRSGVGYYATTAGHCADTLTGYTQDAGDGTGIYVGTVRQNNLTNPSYQSCPGGPFHGATTCSHADAEIMDIGVGGVSNLNLLSAGGYTFPVVSAEGWDADKVGDEICMSGWASGFVCGTEYLHNVDLTGADVDGNPVWLKYQRVTTFQGNPGDSGASVLGMNQSTGQWFAVGSWAGNVQYTSYGYFSHIWDVENQLNVQVVTWGPPY